MLPVVEGLFAGKAAQMAGDPRVVGDDVNLLRIDADADDLADQLTGRRVSVAIQNHQARTGDLAHRFDVAIKGGDHRHQAGLLVFQHLGDGEFFVLGMPQFLPQCSAAFQQPGIEFGKRTEAFLAGVLPDPSPAVLNVLLDHAFLPAGGDIAEVRIEQVVRSHR